MNEITALHFAFGTACMAIGITPEALRNWLTKKHVEITGERTEGGHRRFSLIDIAILAIVVELWSYGVKAEQAYSFTSQLRRDLSLLSNYKRTPISALLITLHGFYLFLRPVDRDDWVAESIKFQPGQNAWKFRDFHDSAGSAAVISALPVAVNAIRRALSVESSSSDNEDNESARLMKAMDEWLSLQADTAEFLQQTPKGWLFWDSPTE